jgi:hypothetical protein
MGVTGFYSALTKMFPWAAKKIYIRNGRAWLDEKGDNNQPKRIPFSPEFAHLFFDCNSELYSAAGRVCCDLWIISPVVRVLRDIFHQLAEDELDHMSAKLWESLDSLINAVSAQSPSSVFLALDGPGIFDIFVGLFTFADFLGLRSLPSQDLIFPPFSTSRKAFLPT